MAKYWMHNGFLQVEGQKMSKSLGNFFTIQQILNSTDFGDRDWDGEDARLAMLQTHYRQPIDWTVDLLTQSRNIMGKWLSIEQKLISQALLEHGEPSEELVAALCDDLNLSEAMSHLHSLTKLSNSDSRAAIKLVNNLRFLGILSSSPKTVVDRTRVVRLVEDRLLARHNKDWKESDRIRDELDTMGIAIKDNKDGTTTWEVKR